MKFEIAETTTTGEQSMTENTVTTALAETTAAVTIDTKLAAWKVTTAELKAIVESTKGVTIAGHAEGPKKGREAVHNALMKVWRPRTAIDAKEKELCDEIKAVRTKDLGNVETAANELRAILSPREAALRADRDAYDAEQERIKKEAEDLRKAEEAKASEERRKALQARVDIVATLGGQIDLVGLQTATDEEFAAQVTTLTTARDERDRLAKIERDAREAAEAAERERIAAQEKQDEADRIERERVAAEERAEQKRIADANAAEAARLEKLRQETEAVARKVQEERESAERAEQDRKDAEAKKERDRLQAEADANAETERLAQEEADRIAEAARVAALAPDLDKLRAWAAMAREAIPALPTIADPELSSRADAVAHDLLHRIAIFLDDLA